MAAGLAGAVRAPASTPSSTRRAAAAVIAQAGHLPPVLVLPGGATAVLDLPAGLPLGLGAAGDVRDHLGQPAARRHAGPVHRRAGGEPQPSRWTTAWPRCAHALGTALADPAAAAGRAPAPRSPGHCASTARTTSPWSSPGSARKDRATPVGRRDVGGRSGRRMLAVLRGLCPVGEVLVPAVRTCRLVSSRRCRPRTGRLESECAAECSA